MPIPSKRKDEEKNSFMSRCMSDEVMKKEFPDQAQRTAVCMSKAVENEDYIAAADFQIYFEQYGSEEEVDGDIYIPEEYLTLAQIRAENYGYASDDEDEDDDEEEIVGKFKYKDPQTGEFFYYERQGVKEKNGKKLVYVGKAAEKEGRKVQLNKPFRTPDGPKKFSVYVKNDKGNIVKVNFGDPNMTIKKNDPERRKSFRARHRCDTDPAPRWKARFWACKSW